MNFWAQTKVFAFIRSPDWFIIKLLEHQKCSLHWAEPRNKIFSIYAIQPWKAFRKIKNWKRSAWMEMPKRELRVHVYQWISENSINICSIFFPPTECVLWFQLDSRNISFFFLLFCSSICCNDCDWKEEFKRKKSRKKWDQIFAKKLLSSSIYFSIPLIFLKEFWVLFPIPLFR